MDVLTSPYASNGSVVSARTWKRRSRSCVRVTTSSDVANAGGGFGGMFEDMFEMGGPGDAGGGPFGGGPFGGSPFGAGGPFGGSGGGRGRSKPMPDPYSKGSKVSKLSRSKFPKKGSAHVWLVSAR